MYETPSITKVKIDKTSPSISVSLLSNPFAGITLKTVSSAVVLFSETITGASFILFTVKLNVLFAFGVGWPSEII